jgi:hypothetical protein
LVPVRGSVAAMATVDMDIAVALAMDGRVMDTDDPVMAATAVALYEVASAAVSTVMLVEADSVAAVEAEASTVVVAVRAAVVVDTAVVDTGNRFAKTIETKTAAGFVPAAVFC